MNLKNKLKRLLENKPGNTPPKNVKELKNSNHNIAWNAWNKTHCK